MECVKSYANTNSDGAEDGADFPDLPAPRQLRCGRALLPFGNYSVSKVTGETNTDDLSPAQEAWSRPDIPLHAKAMLVNKMPEGLAKIETLKEKMSSYSSKMERNPTLADYMVILEIICLTIKIKI